MMWAMVAAILTLQTQEERIEALEKKILQQEDELKQQRAMLEQLRAVPPEETLTSSGMQVEFKDGVKFHSDDGNFNAHIGGRLLTHARLNFDRPDDATAGDNRPDGFFVRQARLEMSGDFWQKQFEFKVQLDVPTAAAANSGTLQDGYLGWTPMQEFNLRVGQFKEPFSQEETTSTRFIDFVDRSVMNRLVPARDIGAMIWGDLFEQKQLRYEVGVFNGAGRGIFNTDDETDLAVRLQAYPFRSVEGSEFWTQNLRFGVAGTFGDVDQETAFADYVTAETTTRWLDVDGTVLHKGDRDRFGAEFAWVIGPVGVRSEYMTRDTDVREGAVADEIRDQAWYFAATWLVTGEDKPMEGRVVPAEPFDLETGGLGAFEMAFRFAGVDVDDDLFANGFALGGANANAVDSFAGGFNWYLTRHFRYSLDFIHNKFDDDVLIGATRREDDENVLLMRFQIDF